MKKQKAADTGILCLLIVLVVAFITPIFFVLMNSFKGKLYISENPFSFPRGELFAGITITQRESVRPVFSRPLGIRRLSQCSLCLQLFYLPL